MTSAIDQMHALFEKHFRPAIYSSCVSLQIRNRAKRAASKTIQTADMVPTSTGR
jgi:hypothetical protein